MTPRRNSFTPWMVLLFTTENYRLYNKVFNIQHNGGCIFYSWLTSFLINSLFTLLFQTALGKKTVTATPVQFFILLQGNNKSLSTVWSSNATSLMTHQLHHTITSHFPQHSGIISGFITTPHSPPKKWMNIIISYRELVTTPSVLQERCVMPCMDCCYKNFNRV